MITDRIVIDAINKWLHREYRVLDGRPIYRIVWSADQLEIRKGLFSDFYGHIFIRECVAIREIRKYWHFEFPCWVFEKLVFISNNELLKEMQEELVQSRNGTYEPIYSFRNEFGPLPVARKIVEYILHSLHNPVKRTAGDYKRLEEISEQEEVEYFEDRFGEDMRSPLFAFDLGMSLNSSSRNTPKFRKRSEPVIYTEKTGQIEGASNGPIITEV